MDCVGRFSGKVISEADNWGIFPCSYRGFSCPEIRQDFSGADPAFLFIIASQHLLNHNEYLRSKLVQHLVKGWTFGYASSFSSKLIAFHEVGVSAWFHRGTYSMK